MAKTFLQTVSPLYTGYSKGKIPAIYGEDFFIKQAYHFKDKVVFFYSEVPDRYCVPGERWNWPFFKSVIPANDPDDIFIYEAIDAISDWLHKHHTLVWNETNDFKVIPKEKWYEKL